MGRTEILRFDEASGVLLLRSRWVGERWKTRVVAKKDGILKRSQSYPEWQEADAVAEFESWRLQ